MGAEYYTSLFPADFIAILSYCEAVLIIYAIYQVLNAARAVLLGF